MAALPGKKRLNPFRLLLLTLIVFLLSFFFLDSIRDSYAFYGLFGDPYSFPGLGGTLGSMGFGGWYGSQQGLGNSGLGFAVSGMYGAWPGIYGLGGCVGFGGLGGYYPYTAPGFLAGLSGAGGLSGLGSLGLFGLGGFLPYGLNGLSGLYNYGPAGLAYLFALNSLTGLGNSWLSAPVQPAGLVVEAPGKQIFRSFVKAEQAGSWEGVWFSLLKSSSTGKITLDLVEDPVTNGLSGSCAMLLNRYITGPVDVSGVFNPADNTFVLNGTYVDLALKEWSLKLDCTLDDPESISGQYIIHDLLYTKGDIGKFDLSLIAPSIPAPAPTQVVTAPTTVPTAVATPVIIPTALAPILGFAPIVPAPIPLPLPFPFLLPTFVNPLFSPILTIIP